MSRGVLSLQAALGVVAIAFVWRWYVLERPRQRTRSRDAVRPRAVDLLIGFVTNFFDASGARFIRERRYNLAAAVGLTLGGIPGVLIAVFIVGSLPLTWLRWLVVLVVLYAATLMLSSARRPRAAPQALAAE